MWVLQYWSEFSTILYADDDIDSPVWVTKNGWLLIHAMLAKSHEHTHSGNQIYVHAGYHSCDLAITRLRYNNKIATVVRPISDKGAACNGCIQVHPSDSDAGGIPPRQHQTWRRALREEFVHASIVCWIELYCFGVRRYFWKRTNKCVVELQTLGGKKSSVFNACNSGLMLGGKFKKIRGMMTFPPQCTCIPYRCSQSNFHVVSRGDLGDEPVPRNILCADKWPSYHNLVSL